MTSFSGLCFLANESMFCITFLALSDSACMALMASLDSPLRSGSESSISEYPITTASGLFTSWVTPEMSSPMAASFADCRSCSCKFFLSVMSNMIAVKMGLPSTLHVDKETSAGNSSPFLWSPVISDVDSLRCDSPFHLPLCPAPPVSYPCTARGRES